MKMKRIFRMAMLGVFSLTAAEYRIEAENFPVKNRWRIGIDQGASGGKMLFSAEKKDNQAKAEYNLPEGGRYSVWVRTMSFGEGYRRAEVLINGKSLGQFGDDPLEKNAKKPSYLWKRADVPLELSSGKLEIVLNPNSGLERVDAILLTTEENFDPANAGKVRELLPLKSEVREEAGALPEAVGKGPAVLVLTGGRPWVGKGFASMLARSGCSVTGLDSVYLDGLGGASIKTFLTDLREPEPKDGITPALKNLDRFKLVIVTGIPERFLVKLYTPERIAALRRYVESGGCLLLGNCTPPSAAELLPVIPGKMNSKIEDCKVKRPSGKNFEAIPGEWKLTSPYREAELRPDAKLLAPILDGSGKEAGIFLAERKTGKGKVVFFNDEWAQRKGLVQLCSWAYGNALLIGIAAEAGGLSLNPESGIYNLTPPPARKTHESLALKIDRPELSLQDSKSPAKIAGREITLGEGIRLAVEADGSVEVFWPGRPEALVRKLTPPVFTFSEGPTVMDDASFEAVTRDRKLKQFTLTWHLDRIAVDGPLATLFFTGNDGSTLAWQFKSGTLRLDGRTFSGFAERISIEKSPRPLESMEISSRIALSPEGRRVRRFACYVPPRGYAEFDLSGKKDTEVRYGGFFGDGQPFTWLVSGNGVYTDFVDSPCSISARQGVKAGDETVAQRIQLKIGRRKAPLSANFVWHMYSPGAERGNNDWMAMYQFQRENLRRSIGLRSIPPEPMATHQNVCTNNEIAASLAAARKLGFKMYHLPWCPSAIEKLDGESALKVFSEVRAAGLIPSPWTAGDYSHGDSEKIFANKSWYLYDAKGKLFQYFGIHPVLDLNNQEFRKWYFELMGRAVKGGMGGLYLDMYGAASGNVNYGTPESETGIHAMAGIFRFFGERGIPVRIEGQNPLVLDTWWFRKQVYAPFTGREFALVGTAPGTHLVGDGLELDYFRMAMYNSFGIVSTDGYAAGFERVPGEIAAVRRIGTLNPPIARARENVGMPFVRETPFGTVWIGDKGGALFFYDAVKEIKLDLPEGWMVEGHGGNILRNVPEDTVILLRKN
ncbi:MAG: hypothetical protein BWY31_00740 [Lentisphaerae bacterium ADurb.Bin242]|nr:MAG: hypothetical protein BWY31_00740 [Lentisphaerae bacterium ADurb.Bin242]